MISRWPIIAARKYALTEFADKEVIVIAFLGNECPLCRQYGPRLEQLSKEFADRGVAFLGINSNQQDTPTEVAAFVRACEITFPLLKDPGNVVADQFVAVRVPEVFVLDKNRQVRYRGSHRRSIRFDHRIRLRAPPKSAVTI